jgi:hypothetical protein
MCHSSIMRPRAPMRPHFLHDGEAAKQIWLHVEPIEAAHVAGRIDAGEMHGAHSLEIVTNVPFFILCMITIAV